MPQKCVSGINLPHHRSDGSRILLLRKFGLFDQSKFGTGTDTIAAGKGGACHPGERPEGEHQKGGVRGVAESEGGVSRRVALRSRHRHWHRLQRLRLSGAYLIVTSWETRFAAS